MTTPAHPGRTLFVNLPVADVERSTAFFAKLGFSFNPTFTDETAACMLVGEHAFVMLLSRDKFAQFAKLPIADSRTHGRVGPRGVGGRYAEIRGVDRRRCGSVGMRVSVLRCAPHPAVGATINATTRRTQLSRDVRVRDDGWMSERVFVDDWQMQCCGVAFAVGSTVTWTVFGRGGDASPGGFAAELDPQVTAFEDHHNCAPSPVELMTGRVTAIGAVFCKYEPVEPGIKRN